MVVDISSLPESFYKLKRVCIQIPEILLGESDQILEIFVKSYPNIEFLLVLDSLGGSCCPDFVARERVQAEALVKVGVSCIADTEAYFSVPTRDDYILLRTYQSALNSLDQLCLDQKFVCIISRAVVSSKEFLGCQNKGFQIAHVSIQKAMTGRLDGVLLFMHLYDWEIELLLLINPSSISFNWDGTTWRSITASRIRAKRYRKF